MLWCLSKLICLSLSNFYSMNAFLSATKYIDAKHPSIVLLASQLAHKGTSQQDTAKACFEYVRDNIPHSMDYKLNPVTLIASDVLKHKTGFCYAKSHLLAALLRANNIPAGLCYQRLTLADDKPPFCLHGLNAIYLEQYGWFRVDARGNKEGINAQFNPQKEQLAFELKIKGECDLPEIWAEPIKEVVTALKTHKTYDQLVQHLPDVVCF